MVLVECSPIIGILAYTIIVIGTWEGGKAFYKFCEDMRKKR